MEIKKASGDIEHFNSEKLCQSVERAGGTRDFAKQVCAVVESKLEPGASTTKIFRDALRELVKEDIDLAAKYSLRHGVGSLGPTGFLFEQYLEALLEAHGHAVERNIVLEGHCTTHEIDLRAEKGDTHFLVEAKFRNQRGVKTHIDVVMYADARLRDIEKKQSVIEKGKFEHTMWVMTNTKFTKKAIEYGTCRGIRLTGWSYPRGESLEDLIVAKKLYPITVLPAMKRDIRTRLMERNVILAQDLLLFSEEKLQNHIGMSSSEARSILAQAHDLLKK